MKANELRIENIVMYDGDIVKVIGIKQTGLLCEVWLEDIYDSVDIEELKPIELTLGILDKCKFDNYSRHYNYDIGEIDAYVKKSGNNVCLSLGIFGHGFGDDIEYLHELQNFYFENTKQELEVKL